MAIDRTILRLGKDDAGRAVSSEDFADAEFDEPWRYERESGRLVVMPPSGEGHLQAANPWRDRLILFSYASPGIIEMIATEAWIRVDDGIDRIADIAVYLATDEITPRIPDRIPDLIFEIVSPDRKSRDRDYLVKKVEYHRLGVKEYLIVDGFRKEVIVRTHAPDHYLERILIILDVYETPLLLDFEVRLSDVF